jgi:hypothetical protein
MLIIGILAGYIAEKVTSSDHGLLTNLLVGIAGSFVGGTLANVLNIEWLARQSARCDHRRHSRLVDLAEHQGSGSAGRLIAEVQWSCWWII